MASGSPHITVFRGDPWLEGSGGTFNKRYFSGCVYFSSPDGLKRIKLMELARGQSCSEGLSISVTDSLASLLDDGKKEHLEMCVKPSCEGNIERQPDGVRIWARLASVLECHADRNLINDLNNPPLPGTPDDELLSVCITNVKKGVDELMDALIFECGILNERGVICLDDYAGCTTDAAISRRCGTIAGYANTTCNNWKNIGKIDSHINCYVIQARVKNECTSSYRKCITEADQFSNLAFNLIRDLSIGLLDAVTMRGEIQTGSDYSLQDMGRLPVIESGAGECPYHTGIGAAADSKIRDCIRTTCSSILYDSSTLNSILPSGLQKDWKYELVGLLSSKCNQMSQLLLDDYKRRGECRSYGEVADVLCAQLLSEGYTGQDYSFTEESMGDCRDILTRVGRTACDKVNEGQC